MHKNSTSLFNNYNGDVKLMTHQKVLYLFGNLLDNISLGHNQKKYLQELLIDVSKIKIDDEEARAPSRIWCDIFWEQYAPIITAKLKTIRALEVGCGSGKYGIKVKDCLPNKKYQYTGVDANYSRQWDSLSGEYGFNFIQSSAYSVDKYWNEDYNLIFTQSALEHFDQDLLFLRDLKAHINKSSSFPVFQLHLIPTPFCLVTYLLHGVRQYDYYKIKKSHHYSTLMKLLVCTFLVELNLIWFT